MLVCLGMLLVGAAFAEPGKPPRPEEMAQRIRPAATLKEVSLAESQLRALREAVTQARGRDKTGTHVLLSGAGSSGRRVAEALAGELKRDLWRVDLSAVTSKYLGETEKNLSRLFDRAEAANWILFFDEADALFGKRTEVKDAHDRYANIEVNALLQRIEEYHGLVILTSNARVTNPGVLRRFRHVVKFPPD